jgi:uncharacterized protein
MIRKFRWNAWNIAHLAEHGVSPEEAEQVVRSAQPPYPRREATRKYRVRGQTSAGYFLQVIYLIELDRTIYVIHARPLNDNE